VDRESLVSSFAAFCGPDQFKKFVRGLNTTCRRKRRLLFWQNELWRRFAGAHEGEVPVTFPEIAEVLRLCPVHGCYLQAAEVPILYRYVMMEDDYREAHAERFPFANDVVLGGCCVRSEKTAVTDYCEQCREERKKWEKARKSRPSPRPKEGRAEPGADRATP
jgi:hypothetical protein